MLINRILLIAAFFLMLGSASAQNMDSLWTICNNEAVEDSLKLKANYKLILAYQQSNPDSAVILSNKQIELAKKVGDKKKIGWAYFDLGYSELTANNNVASVEAYKICHSMFINSGDTSALGDVTNNLAYSYLNMGAYEEAFEFYTEAMSYAVSLKDTAMEGRVYNQLAMTRDYQGRWLEALDLYFKSLKIFESLDDEHGIGVCYVNIATIYDQLEDVVQAEAYFKKALVIKEKIKDEYGISIVKSNLANIYADKEDYDKAFQLMDEVLVIYKKYGAVRQEGVAYCTIGGFYSKQDNYRKAIDFYEKGIVILRGLNASTELSKALSNLGENLMGIGNYQKGKEACAEGLKLSKESGYLSAKKANCRCLSKAYDGLGEKGKAFSYYKQFIGIRDSLVNEDRNLAATRKDLEFGFAKQQFKDSLKNVQAQELKDIVISEQEAQIKTEKIQKYGLTFGILLVLILGGVSYRSYRIKKKDNVLIATQKQEVEAQKLEVEAQKDKIENQNLVLETKNKEITDSIQYAKRIQTAILPPDKLVKEFLEESFVFYLPKDIVAGDFYWMETMSKKVLFAAADCTGHGVPGAMVSVLCNNGLNRSVREYGLTEPGKILDKTREIVVQEFEKSEEDVSDGMDIALCSLEGNNLEYAGAHNPLWIVRSGSEEIEEIKANKEPIGKFDSPKPYTTHKIKLNKGDTFYVFSDGYADQFGGEKGKKMKTINFKKLLLRIRDKSMAEQKELIACEFDNWRGSLEQLDDVCVIGVRI